MADKTQTVMHLLHQLNGFPGMMAMHRHHDDQGPRQGGRGPMRLLRLIKENDGLTNSEIAEQLDIRPSSVSAGLARLEEDGFITRETSEDDKRVTHIHLTDDGKKFIETMKANRQQLRDGLFDGISEEEQDQLITSLTKLVENVKKVAPDFEDMRGRMPHPHHFGGGRGRGPWMH